ncbi:MAG TPA: ATP-dependent DNA helicase RecG [Jatrophihabitantaceae bacterium]|jgi:ATP-dependent DNA helicase RecG|nr:ATP-dependent DNA helicase RecG [Jatrophihabitantaceae bacterium]
MARLATPLTDVLGGKTAKVLATSLQLNTVAELLRHYPRRLAERGELTDLARLAEGDDATVMAEVRSTAILGSRSDPRKKRLEVVVGDGRQTLKLTYFGARQVWREKELRPGARGLFAGKVSVFNHTRQLTHPEYVLLGEGDDAQDWAKALIPVYPATKDLRSWDIAKSIQIVLDTLDLEGDAVPAPVLARHRLLDLGTALRLIHQPQTRADWAAARRRLAWDEALGVQLALAQRRAAAAADPATERPARAGGILSAFDERLPFTLTAGQRDVGRTLSQELAAAHPMHRLLQGEVGSGKTVVALRAMLQVVDAGGQAALLAPTEVLAAQHARTMEAMLGELAQAGRLGAAERATRVALLTGSLSTAARRAALLDAAGGAAGIVIGTHALIQEHVQFADLGLVVVDEQHRFGVEQRDALRAKAIRPPHLLVMTATPIPRTVAMTVFGDLDVSTLTELPVGRSPISTSVVPAGERPAWLDRAWQRIREEVVAGRQAYVVCPRIGDGTTQAGGGGSVGGPDFDLDDSDLGGDELPDPAGGASRRAPVAVLDALAGLESGPLAGLRLAALHGRLPADEKDAVMRDFTAGRVDVLVATTVIEVGIDVPNATVMVLLDADRFGVSQLHQLRGRVGRGAYSGLCLLVTEAPAGTPSRERLDAVAATTDGFELAQLDVAQRREGDVLGVAQSGRRSQLRLLSLLRDADLILEARREAFAIIQGDPKLDRHPLLAAQVADLIGQDQAEYLEKA